MSAAGLRPLPARPSLEHERKAAKALLRRLKAGDPDALARAEACEATFAGRDPRELRLADAQLVLAREYGFASWPRLVRWFEATEREARQVHARRYMSHPRELHEGRVRWYRADFTRRDPIVGRTLAAFVPRFYGLRLGEVFALEPTDDELRLAVARQAGASSWEVLLERVAADERFRWEVDWTGAVGGRVAHAIRNADLAALQSVFAEHPELLRPADDARETGLEPLSVALHVEREVGREHVRPIVDWLVAQGFDLQRTLDVHLLGHMGMEPEAVRWLLRRGADPNWIAPNGISVLEHALLRWWNGDAVDVLAAGGARPRPALWIAAGLGDVEGVRRFLDRDGRPTAAARRDRPDFNATTIHGLPQLPDADDEEILVEALFVAMLNERGSVIEYLASRSVPLDSLVYGSPLGLMAVGNMWVRTVEALVRCGANLDLRGRESQTPREMARELFVQSPDEPLRRRIAELCGLDVVALRRERDARPPRPPGMPGSLTQALELAANDAERQGRAEVDLESLTFGLLRAESMSRMLVARVAKVDVQRLHADLGDRLRAPDDRVTSAKIPLGAEARSALDAAIAMATDRKQEVVFDANLLLVLARDADGPLARLLSRYSGDREALIAELEKGTEPRPVRG
jgi:hypothetical protein